MFLLNSVARLAAAITIVLAGVVSAPSTTNAARVCGLTEFSETVIGGSANLSEAFGIIPEFIAQVGIGPGSAVTKFRIAGSPLPRQTAYGSSTLYSRFICGDSSTPVKFVFGPADYRDSYQWLITWRPDGNHEAHLGELCPTGSSRSLGSYERRTSANTVVSENYCDRNPKIYTDGRLCFGVAGAPGDVAVVNLTPTAANGGGFGVLVSSDVPEPPNASNVNFNIGTLVPNVALAPIGADGKVCYENSTLASVHLIADHLGTIKSNAFALATTSGAPDRKIDTR